LNAPGDTRRMARLCFLRVTATGSAPSLRSLGKSGVWTGHSPFFILRGEGKVILLGVEYAVLRASCLSRNRSPQSGMFQVGNKFLRPERPSGVGVLPDAGFASVNSPDCGGTTSMKIQSRSTRRYCRGDWGAPKSDASNATIGVNRCVIARIRRMRLLTVEVKAGTAVRKCRVVKSDGPNDLVFQSVQMGKPIPHNDILSRFIKPAARAIGMPWVNWRSLRTTHCV